MAKLPMKSVPWLVVMQGAMAARDHWGKLPSNDRAELARLLKTAKGRPSNLTAQEKTELRRLVGRLDLPGLGRNLVPLASRGRRRRF